MMPKEQQEYIDLYNDVEISQALFEEFGIKKAGFFNTRSKYNWRY